ncbi:MAG: hypothetical protein JO157_02635 [Acetobacteraceae bacterium]|nr:hypothetical protein [Acetobacteraceae bacterium]
MSDDSTNMILNAISMLTGKVDRVELKMDRLSADIQDVKLPLHGLETSFAAWMPSLVNQAHRLDIREAGE